MPAPSLAHDPAWPRDAAGLAANVAGVVLIERHPAGHPLHALPCGILIVRAADAGYGRLLWYN